MSHKRRMCALICYSLLLLLNLHTVVAAACHADDQSGLLAFKAAIKHDPTKILATWKPGTDCCTWNGITCRDARVTSVYLSAPEDAPGAYLAGHISPAISKLRFLDGLYLLDLKNISGRIPDSLFTLPDLQFVYLENNKLSGLIPFEFGNLTKLYSLSLAGNRFVGRIPSSLGALTQLNQLKLGGNLLNGPVPAAIGNLTTLTYLGLQNNMLIGRVPNFSTLKNLLFLYLSGNSFSGPIPASIASLAPKLVDLTLGRNNLTGRIPDFFSKFKSLDTLDLSSNRLTGTVPKSFANLTKIFNLDLSRNLLVDPFPSLFVKGIESLDLSYNRFNLGTIPKWVQSSPIIYSLKLARCGLRMRMEDFKPAETYFYDYIDLSENEITGSPVQLLNQTEYLVSFRGSGNKLKFDFEKLRFAKTLTELDLSRNLVYGKVPSAVAQLKKLNVSYNHLCGKLPTTSFSASAFVGNDCLCGSPLGACR
uniref:Leucine-rich repeat-containing N-terminal plant-type domain-containing protein n=1 Tax=Kalanchoe fedtschenkoi TaxID=63787 RepID=A0A7N0ZST5_KALFE